MVQPHTDIVKENGLGANILMMTYDIMTIRTVAIDAERLLILKRIIALSAGQGCIRNKNMADDYIRRQAAIDIVVFECGKWTGLAKEISKQLKRLTAADVVQVVRCRDCKYNSSTHKCLNPDSFFLIPKDDDFCSYGKHREE